MPLNTAPCDWEIGGLIGHIRNGPSVDIDGVWQPARPFGFYSLRSRFRLAWMVFIGQADALRWPGQNPKAY